jgi:hypothetical protein
MFKSTLKIFILLISLMGLNVSAQSTLFQTSSTPKPQAQIPGTSKVMTPQEFQSQVKDISQQNQDQAQKQAADILQKMLPPPPQPEASPGSTPTQPKPPATPAAPATESSAFPPENTEKPNIQKTEMPSGLPSAEPASGAPEPSSSSGSGSSRSGSGSSSSSGSTPQPAQGYTGFQGSTPTTPQQPTSGGWSIKY